MDLSRALRRSRRARGAMSFGTDGMIKQASLTDLGAGNVAVMQDPKLGAGKLADAGNSHPNQFSFSSPNGARCHRPRLISWPSCIPRPAAAW